MCVAWKMHDTALLMLQKFAEYWLAVVVESNFIGKPMYPWKRNRELLPLVILEAFSKQVFIKMW